MDVEWDYTARGDCALCHYTPSDEEGMYVAEGGFLYCNLGCVESAREEIPPS